MKGKPKKAKGVKKKKNIPFIRRGDSFRKFFFTLAVMLVALSYARIVFIQELNIQRTKENIAHQTQVLENKTAERDSVKNIADSVKSESFIQKNARDRLGLVMPNEKVIIHSDFPEREKKPDMNEDAEVVENIEETAEP